MPYARTAVIGLLLLASAPRAMAQSPDPSLLTVERIITADEFRTEGFGPARWLEDGAGYTTVERTASEKGQDLVRYDPTTGDRKVLVSAETLTCAGSSQPLEIADYSWSSDGRKLMIFTNTRRVWRLNTRGDYWVLDVSSGTLTKLGGAGPEATLMFAKFSPDASRVAYVRANDLYVENLVDRKITRLTGDGSPRRSNGTTDWVYEEEFSLRDGFRWSPDGKFLAYWQIDDDGLKDYLLVNSTDALYPKSTSIPYPKVGQLNPSCRVGVVTASGGTTRWVELPGDSRDFYIPRMDWAANSSEIVFQRLNRLQNTNEVTLADAATGKARTVFTDRDDAWVDVVDDLHWLQNGRQFTWISERDGWRHLYAVPREGGEPRVVTCGPYDVLGVLRVDDRRNEVDFLASPSNPTQRHLFRASLDGSGTTRRLTPGDQPGTHEYQISGDGRWAIHTYSTFDKPPRIELISLPDHKVSRTFTENAGARSKLAALRATPTEFFRIDIGDGVELDAWAIRPPEFDPSRTYPLLVHVYGEPAGQTVLDRWGGRNALWHRMMAQRGYVVVSIDNRGTPAPRGRAWRKSIYRQIGMLASQDQAAALRALERKWSFIDSDRVGIWGWSGGGSMSLNAIFRYPELYRTAVAIAFISDQTLYDTIYQERYMGLPADNPAGYRDGSPITFADRLRGRLLLIHGTGDDNCHYQSCERLVNRLIATNKDFRMMAYPNRSHGIFEGENTSRHLYELMTRYLEENLPAVVPEPSRR
ncbi:MAG: ptpA 11 [Planctomycetota bacterium]|nr:ptpA 11 [Planctomycetota bacterium]